MDGQKTASHLPETTAEDMALSAEFARRLGTDDPTRLVDALSAAVQCLHVLVAQVRPSPSEFLAAIDFLTETGHYADSRRQEWVLLADVLGVSSLIDTLNSPRPPGATPNTVAGPFYRADVPELPPGGDISRDGKGERLWVSGRVVGLDKQPVPGAQIEVWQANAEGRYENQEPDRQPEHNLRGRFRADAKGRFTFQSVMPKGYALPSDGPVGRLMLALGLRLERPAHLHFRIMAEGFQTLTTHIFDRADPAIGRDAIFGVKPDLMADFHKLTPSAETHSRKLDLTLVLCPDGKAEA